MKDNFDEFLAAVDDLQKDEPDVSITSHTSSVSADGWQAATNSEDHKSS